MSQEKIIPQRPKFTAQELNKVGLNYQGGQLSLALHDLIWDLENSSNLPRGILLFGPPDCGANHLVSSILMDRMPHVHQYNLDCHQQGNQNRAARIFEEARDRQRCVIVINGLDENVQGAAKILEEIHTTVTSPKLCVFIIAICTEPWAFSGHQLCLFQKKIGLPSPTIAQKAKLLDHFLEKVQKERRLKKKHTIHTPDLERIASFPSLRRAGWLELETCAQDAFLTASRIYQDQDPTRTPKELLEELEISHENLQAVAMKSGTQSLRAADEDAMRRFMEEHYPAMEKKKAEGDYFPVVEKEKTKKSMGEWCLLKFAEAVEPWF